ATRVHDPTFPSGTAPDSIVMATSSIAMLIADLCGTDSVLGGVEGPDTTLASTINNSVSAMLVAVGTEGSLL
ncbi:hypothetical protein C0995_005372, partial [Termitomyces sp. Mi166